MTNHKLTISVIIPAHNESKSIARCLESILRQYDPVGEIIVVNDGSTDNTAGIVSKYPKVRLVTIKHSGIAKARNTGFNKAKGDVIAKLNADVVCDPNWSTELQKIFADKETHAVAGLAKTATIPFYDGYKTTLWSRIYVMFAESYFGVKNLWGANMALRKDKWDDVKSLVCNEDGLHEDQDLSIHLANIGANVKLASNLIVTTEEKSYHNWDKFKNYNALRQKTKNKHQELLISKETLRISFSGRAVRFLVSIIPGLVFYITSLLVWLFRSDRV